MSTLRAEFFDQITGGIVAQLEKGVRPWVKPWSGGQSGGFVMPRRHGGEFYRGMNVLLLWAESQEKGYVEPTWMTLKQANKLGGKVRKGERGTTVIYAEKITKADADSENGEEAERTFLLMRSYKVFNVRQIENLPPAFHSQPADLSKPIALLENAEQFIAATGAQIRHGEPGAFYNIKHDFIGSPHPQQFVDAENYAATIFHELIHWTRHDSRLARDLGRKKWGDEGYAMEELVAELGAAFLSAMMGIHLEPRSDHASYIANWLTVLKNDRRAIFSAAALAQKAVDYLHTLQPGVEQGPAADGRISLAA